MPDNLHNVVHIIFSNCVFFFFNFSSSLQLLLFRHLCHVQFFAIPSTEYARLFSPPLSPRVCSKSCPLSQRCYLIISFSATPSPFAFNFSQYQGLFQQVGSSHQVAKVLEIQFHQQSFQWCCSKTIMFIFFEKWSG